MERTMLFHTPVFVGPEGFASVQGQPVLEGRWIEEAIRTALLYHSLRKHTALRHQVKKRLLTHVFRKPAAVVEWLDEVLEAHIPLLKELAVQSHIPLPEVQFRRMLTLDLKKGEIVADERQEVFEGVVSFTLEMPDALWVRLRAAGMSYTDSVADFELRQIKETWPRLVPFYAQLKHDFRSMDIPLRVGLWNRDPYRGKLLALYRMKDIRRFLHRTLRFDPVPDTLYIFPRYPATPGWAELKTGMS